MPTPSDDAECWRTRAEEARAMAEGFNNPQTMEILLNIAQSYDRLAELAERRGELKRP
jgi:hypothetical protein